MRTLASHVRLHDLRRQKARVEQNIKGINFKWLKQQSECKWCDLYNECMTPICASCGHRITMDHFVTLDAKPFVWHATSRTHCHSCPTNSGFSSSILLATPLEFARLFIFTECGQNVAMPACCESGVGTQKSFKDRMLLDFCKITIIFYSLGPQESRS